MTATHPYEQKTSGVDGWTSAVNRRGPLPFRIHADGRRSGPTLSAVADIRNTAAFKELAAQTEAEPLTRGDFFGVVGCHVSGGFGGQWFSGEFGRHVV